jgi:hypothetical protein
VVREPASQATPRPLFGAQTEARADRVREDVFAGGGEVVVAFDDPGGVAISEQVAGALVPLVEAESMDAVQALHPEPQLRDGRVDDEVVVRRHQAERVDGPVEAGDALSEQTEEGQAVGVVAVDRATIDAARRHVEDAVRQRAAQPSRHLATVTPVERVTRECGRPVTQLLRRTGPLPPKDRSPSANSPRTPGSDPGFGS